MRGFLLGLGLLTAIGLLLAAGYSYLKYRDDEAQTDRDNSGPAWCSKKPFGGEQSMCWITESECQSRHVECEVTATYACVRATGNTSDSKGQWCLKTFGACAAWRDRILRDPEYRDVSACLVYRTRGAQ